MNQHETLIRRLCEASEGSAELSREVREALGGTWSANEPCLTTDLSAAWAEAERRGYRPQVSRRPEAASWHYGCRFLIDKKFDEEARLHVGHTPALALVAALLAAEGER